MQQHISPREHATRKILIQSLTLITAGFCILAIVIFNIFRAFTIDQIARELKELTRRVDQGITFKDGKWDTSRYTADPETPHPSGSSGFSTPLYIISQDGFVIERNAPIAGLLDTADFNHLMQFQTTQDITIVTNETWRMLSKPLVYQGKTKGVIVVAIYRPERFINEISNSKLQQTANYLISKTSISDDKIDTSQVDIRGIDYDVSFEIVTNYNQVLLNNGRMPTFIDRSYIHNEESHPQATRVVTDINKNKKYLIVRDTLYDSNNNPIGIIIAGKSIDFINTIFLTSIPYMIAALVLISTILFLWYRIILTKQIQKILNLYDAEKGEKKLPSRIVFDKTKAKITIDEHNIDLPADSNQYYFCKTIFSNINKAWEVDELLEAMGDTDVSENWRKVYDAMIIINKKTSAYLPIKLIELRDKTYRLNPQLLPLVSR